MLVELARAAGAARVEVVDDAAVARVPAVALAGAHQRANAAAALAAVRALGVAHAVAALATCGTPGASSGIAPT